MNTGKKRQLQRAAVLTILTLLVLWSGATWGEEQSVNPGINEHYQQPDFETWVQRFERPGREVYDQRHAIVEAAGIEKGMLVADIGAGTGLFTRLFAPRVGKQGRVYAVDIAPTFVQNIERIARDNGWSQVVGVVNTARSVELPPNSVDLVFMSDTYHHFEYPQTILDSIHRALKADGRLIVIDFRKIPGQSSAWVLNHVRADKQTVITEIEQAGFALSGEEAFLRTNYYLHFKKAGAP